jgi:hypothetical protein
LKGWVCDVAAAGFSGGSQRSALRNAVVPKAIVGTRSGPCDSAEGQVSPMPLRAFSAVVGPEFQPADLR